MSVAYRRYGSAIRYANVPKGPGAAPTRRRPGNRDPRRRLGSAARRRLRTLHHRVGGRAVVVGPFGAVPAVAVAAGPAQGGDPASRRDRLDSHPGHRHAARRRAGHPHRFQRKTVAHHRLDRRAPRRVLRRSGRIATGTPRVVRPGRPVVDGHRARARRRPRRNRGDAATAHRRAAGRPAPPRTVHDDDLGTPETIVEIVDACSCRWSPTRKWLAATTPSSTSSASTATRWNGGRSGVASWRPCRSPVRYTTSTPAKTTRADCFGPRPAARPAAVGRLRHRLVEGPVGQPMVGVRPTGLQAGPASPAPVLPQAGDVGVAP